MYQDIIMDGHNDTIIKILNEENWLPEIDISNKTDFHIDIDKLKKGGITTPFFAAFSEGYYNNIEKSLSRTLAILNGLRWIEGNNLDEFKIIKNIDDIYRFFNEGKIGAISTIEGTYFLDENNYKELLRQLNDLNIKIIGFNWNYSNNLGEGVDEVFSDKKTKSNNGITNLGIKVLKEMELLGIGIDVSHMNERTFKGVVENYSGPIIATHSNVYNIRNHKRNLKDYQIQDIKRSGGIIGVTFAKNFIDKEDPSLEKVVDHIEYLKNLVGIDYIALGSDFDGASLPKDIKDASEVYKLISILEKRGFNLVEIEKILYKNYIRVLKNIENKREKTIELDVKIESNLNNENKFHGAEKIFYSIKGELDDLNYRLILDGYEIKRSKLENKKVKYIAEYTNDSLFHILTLEIFNEKNLIKRNTNIIYNDK